MSDVTIESLQLEVQAPSDSAAKSIENLSATLGKLKTATKGIGLTGVAKQVQTLDTALKSVDGSSADKISKLADSLSKLSNLGKIKISSSIGNQLRNIGTNALALNGADFSGVTNLATALSSLTGLGKSNLKSFTKELGELPNLAQTLNAMDIPRFSSQLNQLASALAPLANQLNTVSTAFSRLPQNISRTVTATNRMTTANNAASTSYINLWAKLRMARAAVLSIGRAIGSWITKSNEYIESLNIFNVALADYSKEAMEYASKVEDALGIDPGDFIKNWGVFMTIVDGFGVASDRAYIMSKNLTQLAYDINSFYGEAMDVSLEDAMQKLTSGISGELEPLRRLGYDLSQAKLQATALSLGIDKTVQSMTQAEKAELRYYAIMTQVTAAQGDFARTLSSPANQLRVLKAQVAQVVRALGNIFIPVLNVTLPYLIAFAKVLKEVINLIGKFVGFELPEVDYSGINAGSSAIEDLTDAENDATKAAKKLKNAMLGIDELNIISPTEGADSSSIGDLMGGGFGFELPEYNFIDSAVNQKIDELVKKFKEWAGLTEDIDTWSEFFHTKLGRILILVGEIAAGFLAWKLSKSFLNGLAYLQTIKNLGLTTPLTVAAGLVVTITGMVIEWTALKSIIQDGIDNLNFGQTIGGAIATAIGSSFIGKAASGLLAKAGITSAAIEAGMGASLAGALFTGGIGAVVAGLPAFIVGIYSSIKEGLSWLSGSLTAFGSTLTGLGAGAIGAALGAWGGPIGMGIGALIGLVVGLLTDLGIAIYQNWDSISAWAKKTGKKIKEWFSDRLADVKAFPKKVVNAFKNFPQKLEQISESVGAWLDGLPGEIKSWFSGLATNVSEWFDNLWKPIKDYDWKNLGKDLGNKLGNALKSAVTFVTQTLPKKIGELTDTIKAALRTFFTKSLPQFFTEWLPDVIQTVADFFGTLPERIGQVISSVWSGFIDIGSTIIEGIFEGIKSIGTAIDDFVNGLVEGFCDALDISEWWGDVKKWWAKQTAGGVSVEAAVELVKKGWENVKDWIGHIPTLSQYIQLLKEKWTTVKQWIGNIPVLDQGIKLVKSMWTSVKSWIGNIPVLNQGIALAKSAWTTVKQWIGNIPTLSQAISLIKSGWDKVSSWVSNYMGGAVNKYIGLAKSWSSVASWVSNYIGGSVSVTVNLLKGWYGSIKSWLGLSSGGTVSASGAFKLFASGGTIDSMGRSWWDSVPKYATGTPSAGVHGSLFVAGEAGAELVGHVNGTTEVLNQFQLARVMHSSIVSGMAQFTSYWRSLNSQMAVCANAIIRTILVSTDVINTNAVNSNPYDPSGVLAQTIYEDWKNSHGRYETDDYSYENLKAFYHECLEPSINRMVTATETQANKAEQTLVQIGNRTINDAVVTQQKANGYVFAK